MPLQQPTDLFGSVTVRRNTTAGSFVNGRYVDGAWSNVTITANVQPAGYTEMLHLEEGERSKDVQLVISKDALQTLDEAAGIKADRVLYDGAYWEVHKVRYFTSPPEIAHYEAICVREQAK